MRRRAREAVRPNMTAFIDIVFLLLIFFMVGSHFARTSLEEMELPRVEEPADSEHRAEDLVVVNVLPGAEVRISGASFGPGEVQEYLAGKVARIGRERLKVVLRADRATPYVTVKEVMREVAAAKVKAAAFAVLEKP